MCRFGCVLLHSMLFIYYFFCIGWTVTVEYWFIYCALFCVEEIVLQQFLEKWKKKKECQHRQMRILQSEMSQNVKQRNSIAHKVKRAWQKKEKNSERPEKNNNNIKTPFSSK